MKKYQIHTVDTLDADLLTQWKELWERSSNATIFNSAAWFQTCLEATNTSEYTIVVIYHQETLVGILPLTKTKHFGVTVLCSVYKHHMVDTPFLLESYEPRLFKQLFSFLMQLENFLLPKLDGEAVKILHTQYPQLFFAIMAASPSIPVETYHAAMASRLRSRVINILRDNKDLHFELHTSNLEPLLEMMFTIDQQGWKSKHNKSIFRFEHNREFYKIATKHCHDAVRIGVLYHKQQPIGYFYGFASGKVFASYQTSFLCEYSHLRPGQTTLYSLVDALCGQFDSIDMGGGVSRYKMEFTSDFRLQYDVCFSKHATIMLWWKAINALRRINQILFPVKNTRDNEFLFKSLAKHPERRHFNLSPIYSFSQ